MNKQFTINDFCRVIGTEVQADEFKAFWNSVMNAVVDIINTGSTTSLYMLSDRLFSKAEFDTILDSMCIISTIRKLADYLPNHANCAIHSNIPDEQSLHDVIIGNMPLIFYTVERVKNEDDDTICSVLRKQTIVFQYTRLKDRFAIVSHFTPPTIS